VATRPNTSDLAADTAYCSYPSLNPGLVDLARDIEARTGAEPRIAGIAAGALLSMPSSPGYGLWDAPAGRVRDHDAAYYALTVYRKASASFSKVA
jgi:hypothetical protein